jgi:tetratricopeptide (TPR) repeat protein
MKETLEYIDQYFTGQLSETEKLTFEKRCEADTDFAKEVSLYVVVRQGLKDELRTQKEKEFKQLYTELSAHQPTSIVRRLIPYATAIAASLLIFITYSFFFKQSKPEQLANVYIEEKLTNLSVTMGNAKDSLQLGIVAFNQKDYLNAELIFDALSSHETLKVEATKYLGITYLVTQQHEKALEEFDKLATHQNLYANPGKFYKAVTLMKRSKAGDNEEAKKLLDEIIAHRLPGHQEALEWRKHL